jgi:hypothetical protein
MLLVFIQWTIYVANKNYYVVKNITWMKKDNLNETISLLYDLQMSNFIIVILNKKRLKKNLLKDSKNPLKIYSHFNYFIKIY